MPAQSTYSNKPYLGEWAWVGVSFVGLFFFLAIAIIPPVVWRTSWTDSGSTAAVFLLVFTLAVFAYLGGRWVLNVYFQQLTEAEMDALIRRAVRVTLDPANAADVGISLEKGRKLPSEDALFREFHEVDIMSYTAALFPWVYPSHTITRETTAGERILIFLHNVRGDSKQMCERRLFHEACHAARSLLLSWLNPRKDGRYFSENWREVQPTRKDTFPTGHDPEFGYAGEMIAFGSVMVAIYGKCFEQPAGTPKENMLPLPKVPTVLGFSARTLPSLYLASRATKSYVTKIYRSCEECHIVSYLEENKYYGRVRFADGRTCVLVIKGPEYTTRRTSRANEGYRISHRDI